MKGTPDNLNIITDCHTHKLLFAGSRAIGAQVGGGDGGATSSIFAEKVVVCAGAINTPQLLMLSGVGSSSHLGSHGIDCRVDLPGVGQNLQDHLEVYIQHKCKKPVTLYR